MEKRTFPCLSCKYYLNDGRTVMGGYTCMTGNDYYCCVSDYSLYEKMESEQEREDCYQKFDEAFRDDPP